MCGRFGFTSTKKLKDHYGIINTIPNLKPRYNIAPTQKHPIINNDRKIEETQWGLIPFWTKNLKDARIQINARDDSVALKPTFKKAFAFSRCLVPADFFFEWKITDTGKVPYVFKLKNEDMFSFAGIFDLWTSKEGVEIKSFTIITTRSNTIVEKVHNRMPVIIHRKNYDAWLNPDDTEGNHLLKFLKPYSSDEMESYQISKTVNKPSNDDSSILRRD